MREAATCLHLDLLLYVTIRNKIHFMFHADFKQLQTLLVLEMSSVILSLRSDLFKQIVHSSGHLFHHGHDGFAFQGILGCQSATTT